MTKTAVVLFNLGGPDSKSAIKPFLMNFFMDRNIINVPIPLRCILAWRISSKRSKREASDSYQELGNKSPLLENSKKQASALENILNSDANQNNQFKVFICMRYWHPMSPQVVREVRDWGADKVILLPLYPQYSTTTTWSSIQAWNKACDIAEYKPETSVICCYPIDQGFIEASGDNIYQKYQEALSDGHNPDTIRILFSAHGLPEKIIKQGDPYQFQCEKTAEHIALYLEKHYKLNNLDWQICYQSRVGPLKWIGPSTEQSIEKAVHDSKTIIIYPHAFTQEHVETLVELDIEYKHKAEELGIKGYYRAQTVGISEKYINALAALIYKNTKTTCICDNKFKKCFQKMKENSSEKL